jgi:shikimate 5-dehydrogenase
VAERRHLGDAEVLLIGAGGAALSVGYELLAAGARVHLANAFPEETARTAAVLSAAFPEGRMSTSDFRGVGEVAAGADVIINTVPEGCPASAIEAIPRSREPIIAEAPYGEKAALWAFASSRNLVYVGGKAMLFGQFVAAVELLEPLLCTADEHEGAIERMRQLFGG